MKKWIVMGLLFNTMIQAQDLYYDQPEPVQQINSPQPYIKVLNKNASIDQVPLLMTAVDVNISGLIADVTVTQYYKNDGDVPLEAQYVFPGSPDAAVYHLDMQLGQRTINAEVAVKEDARKTYEQAKKAGQTTSLLEQGDPGLFTMNVANILPDDDIRVTLKYTQKIIPVKGRYRFVYPAIGRRSVLAKGNTGVETYNPGKGMGFDLTIQLETPVAIGSIDSKNHQLLREFSSAQQVFMSLAAEEALNFSEDFIIEYDLRGEQFVSGVSIYEEGELGYFLVMMQPPAAFQNTEVVPREYVFVVDSSGSMSGAPMENAQFIASALLTELSEQEYFNVVLFAGDSKLLSERSMLATEDNVDKALELINVSHVGGGTELIKALNKINQIPKKPGYSRSLIVLTDGAITVPDDTIRLLRNTPNQNVFVIGVSAGYGNDNAAINAIAEAGQGLSFYATDDADISRLQDEFLDYVRYPLLTEVDVQVLGFEHMDLFPKQATDLFAEKPLYLTGQYHTSKRGSLKITGQGNGRPYEVFFDFDGLASAEHNKPLKYLWAKEKISDLMFDQAANKAEITALGLSHNLLTEYTSFVAVDEIVRSDGQVEKVSKSPESAPSYGYGFAEQPIKISARLQAGATSKKRPTPEFNTHQAVTDRPSITFIMGEDSSTTNRYYQTAHLLYNNHPEHKTDQVIGHLRDITEIKAYLQQHAAADKPWGLINVVSHSSPWSGLSNTNDQGIHQSLNLFRLHELTADKDHNPVADDVLDAFSEIRLIGCALGGQQHMLNQLSVYMGGTDNHRPVIKAPIKHVYLRHDQSLNSGDILAYDLPWFISKRAGFDVVAAKAYGIDADLWDSQPIEINLTIPDANHVSLRNVDKLIAEQVILQQFLADLGIQSSDLSWSVSSLPNQDLVLTGKGHLISTKLRNFSPTQLTPLDFLNEEMVAVGQ